MSRRSRPALLLTGLLALAIAALALWPAGGLPVVAGGDKTHHRIAFAALCLPVAMLEPRRLPLAMLAMAGFGGGIELVQPWVGRSRELADWLADLEGIALGALAGPVLGLPLRHRMQ